MPIRRLVRQASVFLAAASSLLLSAQITPAAASKQPMKLPAVPAVVDCSTLNSANITQIVGAPVRITSAAIASDGNHPRYCKVQVVADEYARFEVHLPVSSWTQRLLFGGGMGQQPPAMVSEFVTVSWRDLGNRGHEDDFADDYQQRVNFAYRGMHLQVLASKALIAKYYNQAPKFSYYNACSEPGREGMMEVQRFPEDFNGVIAGCPPINDVINNGVFYAWNILANIGPDGKPIITADKLPILHNAVLDQCDGADGLKDGLISDPLSCHPDLKVMECKPRQDPSSCLTPGQVQVAQELYRGAHDAQGNKLEPTGLFPGSELSWLGIVVPRPSEDMQGIGDEEARRGTALAIRSEFNDPPLPRTFKLTDLKFDRASIDAITKLHFLYDATDPDLTPFAKAGHKLILWHSLGDVSVLPAQSIIYYTALQKLMGAKAVDEFVRFYLLPGVYHCGGGEGPAIRDFLTPLMLWVENGIAPGALLATHIPGARPFGPPPADYVPPPPDLTRPIYPYPFIAQYTGEGSTKDAANFVQGPARPAPADLFNWFGAGFYTPGYEKWCTGSGTTFECKNSRN